ncbi:hypothetical protein O181_081436 [Austropuccinia psidii MF-1]|uniref:Reverse transcriptase/retrotransposon-derived protein RNase H-like domain-containing protein n=1 Tax=Austropuccinia psidii MF-1 TaxID=1389203 RepID=A0A9Q3IFY5_9BASI|nr:hypothetical protein [Austropuccinia psidii MF-1]
MDLPPSSYNDYLKELWDDEEEPEEIETVMKVVPSAYQQHLDVFSKVKAEKIPPHHDCDHHIKLEGSLPPVGVIYSLSNQEKKDGGLPLCVDYGKLNSVTRKNKYPVPPMNQLLTVFNGYSIFSKIDFHGACNLLRIKEGNEYLTCFRTKSGSDEYLVMPFVLTNAPTSFQNLVNDIFYDLFDVYVVASMNEIMVFSKSEDKPVTHLSTVLARIRANNPFAKASKCLFHFYSVEYLGYIVSYEGLKMYQEKVQQILNWPPPRSLKVLQYFLGFANFYHSFIKNYSKKISSLTSFLKKDSCFPLSEKALRQFHKLKEAFTTAPILSHFNPSQPIIVEIDASDYALGAVLSQVSDSGKHPIAFYNFKLLPAELNYEIHEKELLGIVWTLQCWRAFLLSLSSSFEVLTNNSSLQYFIPGCLAPLPDALSHWDKIYLERGKDLIGKNPINYQQIIKQDEIKSSKFFPVKVGSFSNFIDSIQKALWQDSQYKSILQDLGKGKSLQAYSLDFSSQLPLFKDQVVVPNDPTIKLNIRQKRHDSPLAGHPGQEKTLKLVEWELNSSFMTKFLKDYVSSCKQCSRNRKYPSQEVWTPQASSNSKWSLDLSFNGFNHSNSTVQFL